MALLHRSVPDCGFDEPALVAATGRTWRWSSEPQEIQSLRAVLERLSRHNDRVIARSTSWWSPAPMPPLLRKNGDFANPTIVTFCPSQSLSPIQQRLE